MMSGRGTAFSGLTRSANTLIQRGQRKPTSAEVGAPGGPLAGSGAARQMSMRNIAVEVLWRAPISSCWVPGLSALRSRFTSPSAGWRWRWSTAAAPGRAPPMAMPASSRATPFFRRHSRRTGRRFLRIALKRSPVANYHLAFLPKVAPWLLAFRAASQPARLVETAQVDAALVCPRGRRARGARGRSGGRAIFAPHRLAETLSQRPRVCRRKRASSISPRSFGIANVPLDADARARARAVAQAGVSPRGALDRGGERIQSAGA